MEKNLLPSKKHTTSTSNDFVTVLARKLEIDNLTLGKYIWETMLECYTFEPGFTCTFVSKTNPSKRCYKKATNPQQTYCSTHVRYGDPNKKITGGKPCNYVMKNGTKKGQECGKVGKEISPGICYCDGHYKTLKQQNKPPPQELKLGSINPSITLDPSISIKTHTSGIRSITNTTYELED